MPSRYHRENVRSIGFGLAALLLCACPRGGSSASPASPGAGPSTSEPDEVASPGGPTAEECAALIAHATELGARELADRPSEQQPTEAEREQVRASLAPLADECLALTRDAYRCAIEATALSALEACQTTRKSSTSNSSVAPGGITPPAPRSP
jgi:hypothetical protein